MSLFHHRFERGASPLTLLALHGTGGSEDDLVPFAQSLLPGASVLSPRGNISEGGAARFFRRFGEGVFDLENLREETAKLAQFVTASCQEYGLDANHVVAIGYSNGANIAASLLLSHPEVLRGGLLLRPMTPFRPDPLPDLSGKSVLCAAGGHDPMVPLANVQELARLLEEAGADVTLRVENASHNLTNADVEATRRFAALKFA